ncbi:MAG: putative RNA methylase [Candidatus Peregrinibacteria bacterium Greene0416_19]|nr:MAG: putative RNA methylase [Candidatus Peregrinibacteria bacterium Greene0416_19]
MVVTAILHLWLRVPYVPTPRAVARRMVKAAGLKGHERVYDLGAGDGRILIEAKRMYPGIDATGCELVPTIWLLGWFTILLSHVRIRWKMTNAFVEDLTGADAIFVYLTPPLLTKLEDKLDRELRPGTRVISHDFRFRRHRPVQTEEIPGGWGGHRRVLVYEW